MTDRAPYSERLAEVAALFLRLGVTAFGGPAAHIAMMHDEVVKRRKWLTEQEFLDLLGATNLIPGPNSTEMAIHLGLLRAGGWGLVVAGCCFILPAMLIVMGLAWLYVRVGSSPQAEWLLYGVKPVVIAILIQAFWNLGRTAVKNRRLAGIGLLVLALYAMGLPEIPLLLVGGLLAMLGASLPRLRSQAHGLLWLPPLVSPPLLAPLLAEVPFSLLRLFFTFLKIGSVLYGSGYVLLAFLRTDFVVRLGWLTEQQLLDAIAMGQVTPGPVFTSATFIGFLLGGVEGAWWATLGIFLPSFIFVALSHPFIPRLRASPWVSGLLDGVNVASLALMVAVTGQLARTSLTDPLTLLIALASLGLLLRFKVNSTWLILGGALLGLAFAMRG